MMLLRHCISNGNYMLFIVFVDDDTTLKASCVHAYELIRSDIEYRIFYVKSEILMNSISYVCLFCCSFGCLYVDLFFSIKLHF